MSDNWTKDKKRRLIDDCELYLKELVAAQNEITDLRTAADDGKDAHVDRWRNADGDSEGEDLGAGLAAMMQEPSPRSRADRTGTASASSSTGPVSVQR